MASRSRFLQRSITHASFHNRLTEEDSMWRRREQERDVEEKSSRKRRYRSRSPHDKRKYSSQRHRSLSPSSPGIQSEKPDDSGKLGAADFGPPVPSNLGINADRWDHALFMQRYPEEHEKQLKHITKKQSNSSSQRKKKHSTHHHHKKSTDKDAYKSKRKHRSRS